MIARRTWLACVAGACLSIAGCGTRAPQTPQAWLDQCFNQLESTDVNARFRMWLSFQSAQETEQAFHLAMERRGSIQYRNASYFRMEAETSMQDRARDSEQPIQIVRDLQVGDGSHRWVRTSLPDGSQPIVLKLPVDGARTQAASVGAAPCDLDPIALLRLCAEHAEYEEVLASEKRYVLLVGTALPSMREEAARLGSGFLPQQIRITLDRDTALPIELEVLRELPREDPAQALATLKIRYLAWTVAPIPQDQFSFDPPSAPKQD